MNAPALQFWPKMRRVERAAWNTIVRCAQSEKLPSIPLPIPVEQWVEGPLAITFAISDLTPYGEGVLGVSRPKAREIMISQTLVAQEARFRFTVAHELGHVVLHSKLSGEFREGAGGAAADQRTESEADRFAAAFLMPLPCFAAEYASAASATGSDPTKFLGSISRSDLVAVSTFTQSIVPTLARRFWVSKSAVTRRFADVLLPDGMPAIASALVRDLTALAVQKGNH
jgi:Zn-dependent peptidase ImmA (M78 family)